jgi:hypothetical protein
MQEKGGIVASHFLPMIVKSKISVTPLSQMPNERVVRDEGDALLFLKHNFFQ